MVDLLLIMLVDVGDDILDHVFMEYLQHSTGFCIN